MLLIIYRKIVIDENIINVWYTTTTSVPVFFWWAQTN